MKKLLFLLAFILFSININAQPCHYCSETDLVQMFKDKELYYKTGYTDSGTRYYFIDKGFYKQIYYLYYDINTLYVIVTNSKKYSDEIAKGLTETYTKISVGKWSSENFNITLNYENTNYSFIFEYR